MNPSAASTDSDVQQLLRDLLARAEAAEAQADAAQKERDAALARNAALTREVESKEQLIDALMRRVESLTRRLAAAQNRPEQLALQFELAQVQRRLDDLNHDRFGKSSERRGRPEGAPAKPKPPKKTQTGHGPTPQPDLPRDEQLHLLDEADCICPRCVPPREMDPWEGHTDDSEEITVVERTFRITVNKKQIYRCGGCGYLDTALGPPRMLPGGRYSTEFAATVAADKYGNAQPLANQVREMADQGLVVTTQTLWDQLMALFVLLLPSYLALQERILDSEVVFADETHWRMMKEGGSKRWWVWVVTDGKRVFFLIVPTRGQSAARQLLRDYDGVVMADRYSVYAALEKERTRLGGEQLLLPIEGGDIQAVPTPDYTLASCWMHGRRGFVKAERYGEASAEVALDLIGALYAVEARARARVKDIADPEQRQAALIEARRELREAESRPLIDELRAWLDKVSAIPELPLYKAVRWLDNGWTELTRFLEDPRIPLDNGLAERVVRGVVLGRNTFAGSRSERGAHVAALFYSFAQTCRLAGVPFRDYLIEAAQRAITDRESVFLPEDFAAIRRAEATAAE